MADTVNVIIGAITNGIAWVRQKYRQFKVWLAESLIAALEEGWKAALTIAGLMVVSIVVGYVWEIMKNNAIVKSVMAFLKSIGDYTKQIAAFLQLDLVLAVVNLGVLVNEKLYNALAPLYEELGNFAEELELDMSYISTFIEVDRAMLQAAYSLTNMGWLTAGTEFATGLSTWLGKLRERMGEYAADPQKIFLDIQREIAEERIGAANEELGKIWAAISVAGDWIQAKGNILIELVDEIDSQVKAMPQEIQDAIKPWWTDLTKRLDDFRSKTWDPFFKKYTAFTGAVEDMFLMYGTDISEIKRRIDDPLDWLRSLLALPEAEQSTLRSTIDEFLAQFMPVKESSGEEVAVAVVRSFAEDQLGLSDLATAAAALGVQSEGRELPAADEIVVGKPWYESEV